MTTRPCQITQQAYQCQQQKQILKMHTATTVEVIRPLLFLFPFLLLGNTMAAVKESKSIVKDGSEIKTDPGDD